MDPTLENHLVEHLNYIETTLENLAVQVQADLTKNKLDQQTLVQEITALESRIYEAKAAHRIAEQRRQEIDTHDLERLNEDDFSGQTSFHYTQKNLSSDCKIRIESSLPIREYYHRFSSGATMKEAKCNKNGRLFWANFEIKPQNNTLVAAELYTWRTDRNAREVAELRHTKQTLETDLESKGRDLNGMLERLAALVDSEQGYQKVLSTFKEDIRIINDARSTPFFPPTISSEELQCYLRAGSIEGIAKIYNLGTLVGTEHFELEEKDRSYFMEVVRIARANTQDVATQLQNDLARADVLQWETETMLDRLDDPPSKCDLNLSLQIPFTISRAAESVLGESLRLLAKKDLELMQNDYAVVRQEFSVEMSNIKNKSNTMKQRFMPAERSQEENAVRQDLKATENQARAMLLAGGAIVQQPRPIGVVAALKNANSAAETWLRLFEGRNLCMEKSEVVSQRPTTWQQAALRACLQI